MNIASNTVHRFPVNFDGTMLEIPSTLNTAAERVLKGRDTATVSMHSGGKLSKWAAQQRKSRRKIAAKSRQRNRTR